MSDPRDAETQLADDLSHAIDRGEVTAVYQPQFALDTNAIVAAEILARWQHPVHGVIAPARFVPMAESLGIIDEIGLHMFRTACSRSARWSEGGRDIEVAINVSLLQFRSPQYVERLLDIANDSGADPTRVIIEVTESTAAAHVDDASMALTKLANAGFTISIDDFGSGHSNEHQVNALPATELKIDQRVVQDETSGGQRALEFLIAFGKRRNMRIVAEGVSTDSQLTRVRELGCDRAQGYLLATPMTLEDFDARLAPVQMD